MARRRKLRVSPTVTCIVPPLNLRAAQDAPQLAACASQKPNEKEATAASSLAAAAAAACERTGRRRRDTKPTRQSAPPFAVTTPSCYHVAAASLSRERERDSAGAPRCNCGVGSRAGRSMAGRPAAGRSTKRQFKNLTSCPKKVQTILRLIDPDLAAPSAGSVAKHDNRSGTQLLLRRRLIKMQIAFAAAAAPFGLMINHAETSAIAAGQLSSARFALQIDWRAHTHTHRQSSRGS